MNRAKGKAHPAHEREALSFVVVRVTVLVCALLLLTVIVDFTGAPASPAAISLIAGLFAGAAVHYFARLYKGAYRGLPLVAAAYSITGWTSCLVIAGVVVLFGDAALASQDPLVTFAIGALAGLLCAIRPKMSFGACLVEVAPAAPLEAPASTKKTMSAQDHKFVAVHEAGHALTLALLPEELRQGAYVKVSEEVSFTSFPEHENRWTMAPYRRWEMLMLMAGPVASDLWANGAMEGGHSDLVEWQRLALSVIAAERTEGWLFEPKTEQEVTINLKIIKGIEDQQVAALVSFLEANSELLDKLVGHIATYNGIDEYSLSAILEDVVTTPEMDLALGL